MPRAHPRRGCENGVQVKWWDVRRLRSPLEELILDGRKAQVQPSLFHSYKGRSLEYDPSVPTKFLVGTEEGLVLCCNRKAKSPGEKITQVFPRHRGPVRAVCRNPYANKCFLTVGDWTAKVSSEEIRDSHIFTTRSSMSMVMDGCWSPTCPSIFFLAQASGEMEMWDLGMHLDRPVLTAAASEQPLLCVAATDQGQVLACGAADGTVTLFQLSPSLVLPQRNGKSLLASFFEREVRREKILEGRIKELRLREGGRTRSEAPSAPEELRSMAEVEAEFLATLESYKQNIKAQIHSLEAPGPGNISLSS